MKRKASEEKQTPEKGKRKRVAREALPESEGRPRRARREARASSSRARPSPANVPLSIIEAARSSLVRLLSRTNAGARENAGSLPETDPSTLRPITSIQEGERELNSLIQSFPGFPYNALRSIIMAVQNLRQISGAEERPAGSPEIEFFFQNTITPASPDDPNPRPPANMVFTIIYYVDDRPANVKTLEPEELETFIPEVAADGDEGQCSICMQNIIAEEIVRKIRCSHAFHSGCVTEWLLKYSNECPLCRKEAVESAEEPAAEPSAKADSK
ncbi:uncharacterized protein NEMAJ01_1267 [Nematocida major]|uniref:uncharacterized protein n=1 Tax=Nematocida major TaxID=1912982 RepID=UPI0020087011|nr:uncharacterized protein NEMAJ01_1267 [Nematocida major]KAH9386371.1 hypothetical protein NEMAJ01_1267 [Nematocida major]